MLSFCWVLLAAAGAADLTGHECATDADCQGGKCSSPLAGAVDASVAATCVDAPPGAPAEPAPSAARTVWPSQWSADVTSWVYPDFSDKAVQAKGRFYYDGVNGRQRTEWDPFTNGKKATQVWTKNEKGESFYYVKTGPLCIGFPITDPATSGQVGVERMDWMENCDKMGLATYQGREQVHGDWADHYTCAIRDEERNLTIAFQNWNSLGLGAVPAGVPVRVTGGNSAPDSKKGSPRLSTVWYSNVTLGPVWGDDFFDKPSWFCITMKLPKKKGGPSAARFSSFLALEPEHEVDGATVVV